MPIEGNNNRCLWIDIAKGIAIIAVVLLHIDYPFSNCLLSFGSCEGALNNGCEGAMCNINLLPLNLLLGNAWHINVFFLLGGFFLCDTKLSAPVSFIPHKLKTLYIPLLCFSIPAALLHNVLLDVDWYSTSVDYGGKMVSEWSAVDMLRGVVSAVALCGREPILSALWFLCALLVALCGLSVIAFVVRRVCGRCRIDVMLIALVAIAACSPVLANVFGVFVPRFNHALEAMFLIYLGYLVRNVWHCRFDSLRLVAVALAVLYVGVVLLGVLTFRSILLQTLIAVSALYVVCFIAKRIESTIVGRVIALCGRESLYIMALQFVAFRLLTTCLNIFGCEFSTASLMPSADGSLLLLVLYLVAGLALPIAFIRSWRWTKDKIKKG